MPVVLRSFIAIYPALFLLLFVLGAGTFHGGAHAGWAAIGHLLLLLTALAVGGTDSLGLGRPGRYLLWSLAGWVVVSCRLSPVPRAGLVGVLLAPAFLLAAQAVARCWADADRRRIGLRALTWVYGGVGCWALLGWWLGQTPGASLPLGHHNLLAAWLVALFPLALWTAREGGTWRPAAAACLLVGVSALLASGSWSGLVAWLVVLWLGSGRRLGGGLMAAGALLLLVVQGGRLSGLLTGSDSSWQARLGYLQAGWRGLLEAPWLGHGPGSTPWTLARYLRPEPGVHPPGEAVGHLHALPLTLLYELGWVGALLVVGVILVFVRRRLGAGGPAAGPARAALLGLLGLGIVSLAGLPLAVTALPAAAAVLAGTAMISHPAAAGSKAGGWRRVWVVAYCLVVVVCLAPLDAAHRAYDLARAAERPEQQERYLQRALALDPGFPLYRARLAAFGGRAETALAAARKAKDVAPLWLLAGALAAEQGEPWGRTALDRACSLDPLGASAPFLLAFHDPDHDLAPRWLGRALAAEPLLLAVAETRPILLAAVRGLQDIPGLDAGWRQALVDEGLAVLRQPPQGPRVSLALEMDDVPSESPSLFLFRRLPWPLRLVEIPLIEEIAQNIELVSAARRPESDGEFFLGAGCTPGGGVVDPQPSPPGLSPMASMGRR